MKSNNSRGEREIDVEDDAGNNKLQKKCEDCPPQLNFNTQSATEVYEYFIQWAIFIKGNNEIKLYLSDIISNEGEKRKATTAIEEALGGEKYETEKRMIDNECNKLIIGTFKALLKRNNFGDNILHSGRFRGSLGEDRYDIYIFNGQDKALLYLNFTGKAFYERMKDRIQNPAQDVSLDGRSSRRIQFPKNN